MNRAVLIFFSGLAPHHLRQMIRGKRSDKSHLLRGRCLFCWEEIDKEKKKYAKRRKQYNLVKDWREVQTLAFIDNVKSAINARKFDSWASEVIKTNQLNN